MNSTYELRTTSQYSTTGIVALLAVLFVIAQIIAGGPAFILWTAVVGVGLVVLAYGLFIMPCLYVDGEAVTLRNSFRDVRIPFSQIKVVGASFGLQITTANGKSYHPRFFGSSTARAAYSRKQHDPIDIVAAGDIRTTARSREVEMFLEDVADHFNLRHRSRGQEITTTIAWDRIMVDLLGLAVVALGGYMLTH